MACHSVLITILLVTCIYGICSVRSLKCRADDEVTNEEDYRDAVRVCMSNLTSERDEQGYRPGGDDSGGSNSGGNSGNGGKRQHNRNRGDRGDRHGNNGGDDSSNSGGGSRRPGRPSNRPGMWGGSCDSGYEGNREGNGDRRGNNNGYGGNNGGGGGNNNNGGGGGNNNNGGGYSNSGGYGGNSGGGYGNGYYGGGVPQHRNRGPMPGSTFMQGGPIGGGPMSGVPFAERPRTRRSSSGFSGSRDGRIGTPLDDVDSCIVHCIFRQMQMLNDNARPDKDAVIAVMTQRVRDRELREFIQYSVDECFEFSQSESNRSLNKCDFAKRLALCLEEKAKRHCDDWDDDGNSKGDQRGDQRGDRDRGSNNQRPPRQHYVGR